MKPVGSLEVSELIGPSDFFYSDFSSSFNRVFSGFEIFENWNRRLLAKILPAQTLVVRKHMALGNVVLGHWHKNPIP
jgi:hypothetical protein